MVITAGRPSGTAATATGGGEEDGFQERGRFLGHEIFEEEDLWRMMIRVIGRRNRPRAADFFFPAGWGLFSVSWVMVAMRPNFRFGAGLDDQSVRVSAG